VIHHYHAPAPRYYRPPRVVYHDYYPSYYGRGSGLAGTLPIVAGGVLGGLVGEQVGYGNHGAIIAGSVAGAVLGHEIGR
jgi:hypothetical protein